MDNNAHQFLGQKFKGQGHQADYCRDRKCIIATELEGLQTSNWLADGACAINCHGQL